VESGEGIESYLPSDQKYEPKTWNPVKELKDPETDEANYFAEVAVESGEGIERLPQIFISDYVMPTSGIR